MRLINSGSSTALCILSQGAMRSRRAHAAAHGGGITRVRIRIRDPRINRLLLAVFDKIAVENIWLNQILDILDAYMV